MVHAATSPFKHTRRVDVDEKRLLLEQACAANVSHVIYISIVGIDRIPYPYYRCKLTAQERIEHAGIPWSILRATQFHSLFGRLLQFEITWPLPIVLPTDSLSQLVADSEVANRLADLLAAGPGGHLPDIGGPEVLNWGDIARIWLRLRGIDRVLMHLTLPGKAAHGFRQGYITCPHCPEGRRGKITWAECVRRQYQNQ